MRTFCFMGAESEQVMSKVLMMKVDKATRVRWSMREEEGGGSDVRGNDGGP